MLEQGSYSHSIIADYIPRNLSAITSALSERGHSVTVAQDSSEARVLYDRENPDFLILGLYNAIEIPLPLPSSTIVLLDKTVDDKEHSYESARWYENGADVVLADPVEPRVLVAHMETILRRKRNEYFNQPESDIGSFA